MYDDVLVAAPLFSSHWPAWSVVLMLGLQRERMKKPPITVSH